MALWNIPIADCWYLLSESDVTRISNLQASGPPGSHGSYQKIKRFLRLENKSTTINTKFVIFTFLNVDESNATNDWDLLTFQFALRSNISAWKSTAIYATEGGSLTYEQIPDPIISSMNTAGTDPTLTTDLAYDSGGSTSHTVSTSWADYYSSNAQTDTTKNIGFMLWSHRTLTQDDWVEFACPMIYNGQGPRVRSYPAVSAALARSEMEFQKSQNPEYQYGDTSVNGTRVPCWFLAYDSTQYIHVPFRTQMLYNPHINIYSPNSGTGGYIYDVTADTDVAVTIEDSNKNGFVFSSTGLSFGNQYKYHWMARSPVVIPANL